MAVAMASPRRCVVWFGNPSAEERDELAGSGWSLRVADAQASGVGARNGDLVVALADLRHGDDTAWQCVEARVAENPGVAWIALVSSDTSAHGPCVSAILRDCAEVFTSPLDLSRLCSSLEHLGRGAVPVRSEPDMPALVGRSTSMQALRTSLRKYAPVDLPVLITGETGTGKEVAARAVHELSPRRDRPFVAINCGALPGNLVQSELFGHERGAFTGATTRRVGHIESAGGGTVFLDEIGDLPLDAQTSLLRFLQEGTIVRVGSSTSLHADVRVLAATHVDLEKAVAAGRFRQDLYYRLNVLRVQMPALREREVDVDLLAQHFLDRFREQHGSHASGFNVAARRALREFHWPGNVRELVNRVQRAAVVAEEGLISVADLDLPTRPGGSPVAGLDRARVSAERDALVNCLRETRFNVSECARRLGIARVTVYRLCKKHGLVLDELAQSAR